jgi:carboxylate-amine ligase
MSTTRPEQVRTIGVEEELMLVDPMTGQLTAVSRRALHEHEAGSTQPAVGVEESGEDAHIEHELFLQQLETTTSPTTSLTELADEIRRGRRAAGTAAHAAGAAAAAMPTPLLVDPGERVTPRPRYQHIYDEFGEVARQGLVCAMHVHVGVDAEEAVGILDRVRPWLPVLLAVSANSPFWRGQDTGYASWRTQIWTRWPSTGTGESFGDTATYERVSRRLLDWGAAFDRGMLYFDPRPSERYPTLEIRVADVCTEIEDATLVAALARGLVETEGRALREGRPALSWRSDELRVASWRASRFGLGDQLVHPARLELAKARDVLTGLVDHVAPALDLAGDQDTVRESVEHLLSRGVGASRQRAVWEGTRDLAAVVADLVRRTEDSWRK